MVAWDERAGYLVRNEECADREPVRNALREGDEVGEALAILTEALA